MYNTNTITIKLINHTYSTVYGELKIKKNCFYINCQNLSHSFLINYLKF